MLQPHPGSDSKNKPATREDVLAILGELDTAKLLPILTLRPTVADLEQALVSLEGDPDIYVPDRPLSGVAGEIVEILTADEEEDAARGA